MPGAVGETASRLVVAALQAVVDALVAAHRIDVYGVGASAFVALDFQQNAPPHRSDGLCGGLTRRGL